MIHVDKNIEYIYKKYALQRPLNLGLEHFVLLVEFFPAILVLNSDGFFDKKEALYLDKLVENIGFFLEDEGFSNVKIQTLKSEFKNEFLYLGENISVWKNLFLETLKNYLAHYTEQKPYIQESIALFAKVSGGISKTEQQAMDFLKDFLVL